MHRELIDALRSLRRSPAFAIGLTATLAIGVGGAIATMSVMDRVLFRPPAGVRAPKEVRRIYAQERSPGFATVFTRGLSYPDLDDLAKRAHGRAILAGYSTVGRELGTAALPVGVSFVTHDYFSTVGVSPLRGRFFTPEETRPVPPAVHPAVLSAGLWIREFGGDSSAVGSNITLSGRTFTVVGIAPRGFRGLDLDPVDVWVPIGSVLDVHLESSLTNRSAYGISVIARMQNPNAWPDLMALLTTQYREGRRALPWADSSAVLISAPLLDARGPVYRTPLERRNTSLATRLVIVAVAVMLVSVLHGAIMLSLRAVHRRREITIRLALGMSRARLVSYQAIEAACIAFLAGGIAVLIAWWGGRALDARVLSTVRPAELGVDGRLLTITTVLTTAVLVATGLLPAIASRRMSPAALRSDGVAGDAADSTLRSALVAAETAACVALVMLAGVSLRSLERIASADFGFDGARLVSLATPFGTSAQGVRDAVASLPFVESVSIATSGLAPGSRGGFAIPGRDAIPAELGPTHNVVGPEYHRVAGLRLVAGRALSETDVAGARNVVVITRAMADQFWPGVNPLGQCVLVLGNFATCRYVIGVVENVRWAIGQPAAPHFFAPYAQAGGTGRFLLVRTRGPATAADAAAIELAALGPFAGGTRRPRATRIVDALEPQLAPLRAASTLFLVFGVLALVSVAGAVYGLISYHVSRRTREIGIRMALGASTLDVARAVARWVATPFAIGIFVGTATALMGGRLIASFLFETSGYDAVVLSGVGAVVCLAALAAAIIPTRRAATLDPAAALRHD